MALSRVETTQALFWERGRSTKAIHRDPCANISPFHKHEVPLNEETICDCRSRLCVALAAVTFAFQSHRGTNNRESVEREDVDAHWPARPRNRETR
ncbi:MAG: hypothetical protein ACRD9S_00440 [Pyrinomonadaceae bacterium]